MANEIEIYNDSNGITRVEAPVPIVRCVRTLKDFQITLQEMLNEEKELKEWAYGIMEVNNIDSFEIDGVTFSRRKAHVRITVDSKRLKAEQPKIYEMYSKASNVSGGTTIDWGE